MCSDHNMDKLEINDRKKNSWKTNKCLEINTSLSNTWVKKKIPQEK